MTCEKKRKGSKGFTLVELVVVIAVLAILAGVGGAAYSGYITKANEAADEALLETIQTAVISACAKDGKVTKIDIDLTGNTATIKATVDSKEITLMTSGTSDTGTEGTDFNIFLSNNTISFKSKTYQKGATWVNSKWTGKES